MAVIILSGPTGTGKSFLAHQFALQYDAAVVSADAMTVYRGMDIATAKPSAQEQSEVRYFGLDMVSPDQDFSVYEFIQLVDEACAQFERVIIAGGTPFYLRALLCPHAPMPAADAGIRQRLNQESDLHEKLRLVDPVLAQRLHPNDLVRIIRGLEVFELTGRPLSEVQKDPPERPPLECDVLWLEREMLRPRLGKRIEMMIKAGYREETQKLLDDGYGLHHKPMSAFAYLHMIHHIRGEITLEECLDRIEKGTWHLARKQRTWGRSMGFTPIGPEDAERKLDSFFQNGETSQ